tara:strand:+ start:532 stop:708 length:177 start_codon:yes stop_codon:yes gene_type:complete
MGLSFLEALMRLDSALQSMDFLKKAVLLCLVKLVKSLTDEEIMKREEVMMNVTREILS